MVATGTHRRMTGSELVSKFGTPVLDRLTLWQHDAREVTGLVPYGRTRRGTDIFVSRIVMEADLRIGVGSICPHFPTGWSGGAKIVLPGVAGEATTAQMHFLGAEDPHLGGDAVSPIRDEMEDFARAIGLSFIVNTVHNCEEEVVAVFAGDFIAAHRAGVQRAQQVWSVPFTEEADLTLSSTSPIDHDLSQAGKGILSANNCTREGGEIVLLSPCRGGYSDTHDALHDYLPMSRQAVRELAQSGRATDPVAAAIARKPVVRALSLHPHAGERRCDARDGSAHRDSSCSSGAAPCLPGRSPAARAGAASGGAPAERPRRSGARRDPGVIQTPAQHGGPLHEGSTASGGGKRRTARLAVGARHRPSHGRHGCPFRRLGLQRRVCKFLCRTIRWHDGRA